MATKFEQTNVTWRNCPTREITERLEIMRVAKSYFTLKIRPEDHIISKTFGLLEFNDFISLLHLLLFFFSDNDENRRVILMRLKVFHDIFVIS